MHQQKISQENNTMKSQQKTRGNKVLETVEGKAMDIQCDNRILWAGLMACVRETLWNCLV